MDNLGNNNRDASIPPSSATDEPIPLEDTPPGVSRAPLSLGAAAPAPAPTAKAAAPAAAPPAAPAQAPKPAAPATVPAQASKPAAPAAAPAPAPRPAGPAPAPRPLIPRPVPARPAVAVADRITACRTFFTKLHPGAIKFLEEQVTTWLKENPSIVIKRTNVIMGEVQEKKTEPNIVIVVWY